MNGIQLLSEYIKTVFTFLLPNPDSLWSNLEYKTRYDMSKYLMIKTQTHEMLLVHLNKLPFIISTIVIISLYTL